MGLCDGWFVDLEPETGCCRFSQALHYEQSFALVYDRRFVYFKETLVVFRRGGCRSSATLDPKNLWVCTQGKPLNEAVTW